MLPSVITDFTFRKECDKVQTTFLMSFVQMFVHIYDRFNQNLTAQNAAKFKN